MADRWSGQSASYGYERFRVWPLGSDSYNHVEFAANWDKVDAILGGPADGSWPGDNGIYGEIERAANEAIPLGMVFPWFRPSLTVPIPSGYAIADGSTLNSTQHDFPGGGNVTLPDLRNRFILGADYNKAIGTPAAEASSPLALTVDGAPGPQGQGGLNAVSLTVDQLPAHTHAGSYTGWSPAIAMWYFQQSTYDQQKNAPSGSERTAPIYPASENFESVGWGYGVHWSAGGGGYILGQHRHTISAASAGSNAVHENRPRYIGIIWLIKVKNNG